MPESFPDTQYVSFAEFQMYVASAEQVTERRLALNRWNYSILVGTLLAVGAVMSWATADRSHALTGVVGVMVLCGLAIVLSRYWLRQIEDYKALNAAKFEIINESTSFGV